jgi:hypothetical protein
MYRAAVRQWLTVKTMPPDIRRDLATQALIWTGLMVLFAWGLIGLVAIPS